MQNSQQGLAAIVTVLLVILVAAGLGAGAYFGYNWWQNKQEKEEQATTPPPAPDPRAGWLSYTDSENGFTLKYPPNWATSTGSFPSTHGQTLKDTAFKSVTDRVFVTVRINPDAGLEAFVRADGVTGVQTAKVDSLDGFAAVTPDSYRVYLGKGTTVYMFTFPGAKTNNDLTTDQVNLLTSFKFTTSTTVPSTPDTTDNTDESDTTTP